MLTGKALGTAITEAIEKKGISKADVARHFGIKPPSISDWCARGTISKDKLDGLFKLFADVVGPEHWGIGDTTLVRQTAPSYRVTKESAARMKLMSDLLSCVESINDGSLEQLVNYANYLATTTPRDQPKDQQKRA